MFFGVSHHEKGEGIYLFRREATVTAVRFHNEGRVVTKIKAVPAKRHSTQPARITCRGVGVALTAGVQFFG